MAYFGLNQVGGHQYCRRSITEEGEVLSRGVAPCVPTPKDDEAFLAKIELLYDTELRDIYKDLDEDGYTSLLLTDSTGPEPRIPPDTAGGCNGSIWW